MRWSAGLRLCYICSVVVLRLAMGAVSARSCCLVCRVFPSCRLALVLAATACGSDEVVSWPHDASRSVAGDAAPSDAVKPLMNDGSPAAVVDAGLPAADSGPRDASSGDAKAASDAGALADAQAGAEAGQDGPSRDASFVEDAASELDAGALGIRGVVVVRSALVIDADRGALVRDRGNDHLDTAVRENDTAQYLTNPGWVGGYLGPRSACDARPCCGAGAVGPDAGSVPLDVVDYYRVELSRGDAVTLLIHDDPCAATQEAADLDLYLLDELRDDISFEGGWRDDSLGSGDTEQVVAHRSGTFWLAVHRPADESSFNDPRASARYSLLVNVPLSRSLQQRVSGNKLTTKSSSVAGRAAVVFEGGATASFDYDIVRWREADEGGVTREDLRRIKQLRRQPGVRSAEPVIIFQPQGLPYPNDPGFARQWHTWPIDLLAGWVDSERSGRPLGRDAVVAVVDTGVAMGHPDFVNQDGTSQLLDDGYDMVSDLASAADGDGRDADPNDPGDGSGTGGGTFHGTHCAGNIAAATNNGLGVVGVAPGARIRPVRVLGRGGGTLDDVVQGILYAAGLPNESGVVPETPSDVINLSLAGPGRSELMREAIAAARAQGSIVIAAAGNFASPADDYTPGGEPGAVTVSAVDATLGLAWYSNYAIGNDVIDLAGVGGDLTLDATLDGYPDGIYSMLFRHAGTTLYGDIEGTSMAAAQVAGVAALMKGVWPEMTPEQFDDLLPQIAVDIGPPGVDREFGYGLLNVPKAMAAAHAGAGNSEPPRAALHLSTRALDFDRAYDVLPLELRNTGGGELQITGVQSADWVFVSPAGVGNNEVFVDRSVLPPGQHSTTLSIESNVGKADVTVRVYVEANVETGDVGPLTVLLLDAETNQVVDVTTTTRSEGYSFQFDDPGPGRFRVVAGSDWAELGRLGSVAEVWAAPFGERVLCVGGAARDDEACLPSSGGGIDVRLVARLLQEPAADGPQYD